MAVGIQLRVGADNPLRVGADNPLQVGAGNPLRVAVGIQLRVADRTGLEEVRWARRAASCRTR